VNRLSCGQSFTPATRVLLATGTAIAIRRLKPGDQVLAYDTATGRSHAQQVTAVLIHHDRDLFNLTISTRHRSQVIHTTASHLFWNPATGTWAKASTTARGTRLATPDRAAAVTVTVGHAPRDHSGWMWDLTITTDHNFYISLASTAVLVHNCNTPEDVPGTIFRTGSRTDGALTDPSGVSFRSSVSSSADGQQIFRPGDKIWAVQTDQLPSGSVIMDNNPAGHVSIFATPEEIRNAVLFGGPDNPLEEMFKALEESGSYRLPK
jgi:hypothetical protein